MTRGHPVSSQVQYQLGSLGTLTEEVRKNSTWFYRRVELSCAGTVLCKGRVCSISFVCLSPHSFLVHQTYVQNLHTGPLTSASSPFIHERDDWNVDSVFSDTIHMYDSILFYLNLYKTLRCHIYWRSSSDPPSKQPHVKRANRKRAEAEETGSKNWISKYKDALYELLSYVFKLNGISFHLDD